MYAVFSARSIFSKPPLVTTFTLFPARPSLLATAATATLPVPQLSVSPSTPLSYVLILMVSPSTFAKLTLVPSGKIPAYLIFLASGIISKFEIINKCNNMWNSGVGGINS